MKCLLPIACLALAGCAHKKMTSEQLDRAMVKMQAKADKFQLKMERQAEKMQAKSDRMQQNAD